MCGHCYADAKPQKSEMCWEDFTKITQGYKKLRERMHGLDLFGKNITGKILCLPITIGSTTGGLVIQTICDMNINPAALLFSETIDSLAASGIVLATVWQNSKIICIDRLGEEFLNSVKTGDQVEIKLDGTVIIK